MTDFDKSSEWSAKKSIKKQHYFLLSALLLGRCLETMKGTKLLLAVLTIACLVVFFSFTEIGEDTPGGMIYHIRLGLQASPWLILDREPSGMSFHVQFPALSWLFIGAAVALEVLRSRLAKQQRLQAGTPV